MKFVLCLDGRASVYREVNEMIEKPSGLVRITEVTRLLLFFSLSP